MSSNIGMHLETLRLSRGYSLREAAKISGLSHGYIRDVELGVNRKSGTEIIPMPQTLRKYADAFRVDFNQLMRIAGHIENSTEHKHFEVINIDLFSVCYIQVSDDNFVHYHFHDRVYIEERTLQEYMILEDMLDRKHFLRVFSGVYANLNQIRSFDEKNSRLVFGDDPAAKFIDISLMRSTRFNSLIHRAVANNNNLSMEININDSFHAIMSIKNILN
jgi:transcriptional regulator with XRE-family HTH domain